MKVLHIYKDFYPPIVGGIEGHINILARGLAKNKIDVSVLVSNTRNRIEKISFDGIQVIKAPEFGRIASAPINPNFPMLLKSFVRETDLFHFHLPNPTAVISWVISGIQKPYVASYHSDIVRQKRLYFFFKPFEKYFFSKVSRIIVASPRYLETSKILQKYKSKSSIIPYGISIDRFNKVDHRCVKGIKNQFKKPIILFIGKFRYYKGLPVLLESMQNVDAILVIIGSGNRELKEKYKCRDKAVFLGELNDNAVNAYLHACDILVLPSVKRSEAFGIVLLEAMACGKAVISTELGTGTSYVNLHYQTGIVVPANNRFELSEAMNKILRNADLRRSFGNNGRERVKKYFTDKKMISDTIDLYKSILDPRNTPPAKQA
ncbi:MAG: glycosyltransferase [Desulfobacteraceae bacterium]|nr:MAG: glycosyltransferase [Desulfobacteraceae bacterium]